MGARLPPKDVLKAARLNAWGDGTTNSGWARGANLRAARSNGSAKGGLHSGFRRYCAIRH
jgi:hypothetical protein